MKDRLANLNNRLEAWFNRLEADTIITDEELRKKAKEIATKENLTLPNGFNFSRDWLLRFKRRRDIGQEVMHGEAGDAGLAGIEQCREHLPTTLEKFELEDIYNLDETGLFSVNSRRDL